MDTTPSTASRSMPTSVVVFLAIAGTVVFFCIVAALSWGIPVLMGKAKAGSETAMEPLTNLPASGTACNVLGITLHGRVVGSRSEIPTTDFLPIHQSDGSDYLDTPNYAIANAIDYAIHAGATDPTYKALLIDVDSGGGSGVGGEEIAAAVRKFGKPSVAVIHGMGASAAYLSASAADTVYAGADSDVGSIGVTTSYLNQFQKDKKDGIEYIALSSGKYKDMFSPDKPLTEEEKKLIMRDINKMHEDFVGLVAEYRHQPKEKIAALADGSTMIGKDAIENGLVDKIGNQWDAMDELQSKIGEPVSLCWQ